MRALLAVVALLAAAPAAPATYYLRWNGTGYELATSAGATAYQAAATITQASQSNQRIALAAFPTAQSVDGTISGTVTCDAHLRESNALANLGGYVIVYKVSGGGVWTALCQTPVSSEMSATSWSARSLICSIPAGTTFPAGYKVGLEWRTEAVGAGPETVPVDGALGYNGAIGTTYDSSCVVPDVVPTPAAGVVMFTN